MTIGLFEGAGVTGGSVRSLGGHRGQKVIIEQYKGVSVEVGSGWSVRMSRCLGGKARRWHGWATGTLVDNS